MTELQTRNLLRDADQDLAEDLPRYPMELAALIAVLGTAVFYLGFQILWLTSRLNTNERLAQSELLSPLTDRDEEEDVFSAA
jgi:uncharacterized membrane protein